jgi:aspartate carbamoyltransferase catalytic subunit
MIIVRGFWPFFIIFDGVGMVLDPLPKVLEKIKDLTGNQILALLKRAQELKILSLEKSHQSRPEIVVATYFHLCTQHLGMKYLNIEAGLSSLEKGEDLEQMFLTLQSMGVNICVVRTPLSHALSPYKNSPPFSMINAGDGSNQHPTQALTDLLTMKSLNLPLEGKTMGIIGDCRHSRVFHSLRDLLPQFGMNLLVAGPDAFISSENTEETGKNIERVDSVDELISRSDSIYLLRVQKERHQNIQLNREDYHRDYGLSLARLKKLKKFCPVFHAGPANIGWEIDSELIHSKNYMGHHQVRNSLSMRMALLDMMSLEYSPHSQNIFNPQTKEKGEDIFTGPQK